MAFFEATTLVENVAGVLGVDEEFREKVDPFVVVAVKARLSRSAPLGCPSCRESGHRGKQGKIDWDMTEKMMGYGTTMLAHWGCSGVWCGNPSIAW
jgi:hypothetical protein